MPACPAGRVGWIECEFGVCLLWFAVLRLAKAATARVMMNLRV